MTRIATIAATVWLEVIRRKDLYVLLILLSSLLAVLVSLNVFGLGGVVMYVKDVGLLMAWLFAWILAVSVCTRQLPNEESRGTIFALLAKPITRMELLAGKWLGAWSVVAGATLLFYAVVAGVVGLKGGGFDTLALLQCYILHATATGVIAAIALALSARMNSDAAATLTYVVTGASILVVPRVPEFVAQQSGISAAALYFLYNLLPHFELFDLRKRVVHDFGPLRSDVFWMVLLYGILLSALFLLVAWLAYRHKRFSRGSLSGY